ncbi:MAG: hypothetical protein U1C33_06180, partial [Candidatus Cloacimonadaceae bacterium]|nr:hypothetical protein [Candidatus Cloacimonadaceae bacterium]
MRRILSIICMVLVFAIAHAQMWQTFTNTSHVYDYNIEGYPTIIGTWGGAQVSYPVEIRSKSDENLSRLYTTKDGLSSNDIRTTQYVPATGALWLGSSTEGISVVKDGGIQIINNTNGLPSNRVRKILAYESQIFVATDAGLSVFYYLETVNFPLLLHQYNVQNTSGGLASNDVID